MKRGLENIVILSEVGVDFRKMLIENLKRFKQENLSSLKLPNIKEKSEEEIVSVQHNSMSYMHKNIIVKLLLLIFMIN